VRSASLARTLLLFVSAAWCGALLFFAAAGARIVLDTAGSRHLGGVVNRALLDALDVASFGVAALLLVLALAARGDADAPPLPTGVVVRLLVVAFAGAFASLLVVTPEMVALRDRMPMAIDLVDKADPLRKAWGRLHGYSSLALVVRILAFGAVFFLAARKGSRRNAPAAAAPFRPEPAEPGPEGGS
jgi:hypothetical protein